MEGEPAQLSWKSNPHGSHSFSHPNTHIHLCLLIALGCGTNRQATSCLSLVWQRPCCRRAMQGGMAGRLSPQRARWAGAARSTSLRRGPTSEMGVASQTLVQSAVGDVAIGWEQGGAVCFPRNGGCRARRWQILSFLGRSLDAGWMLRARRRSKPAA